MSANARQVGGEHYKAHGSAERQHWDLMLDLNCGPGYFAAVITKYLFRWRDKNGVQDLEKVEHYLEKWIEAWGEGKCGSIGLDRCESMYLPARFEEDALHFKLDRYQRRITERVLYAECINDLETARDMLLAYIELERTKQAYTVLASLPRPACDAQEMPVRKEIDKIS